MIATAKQTKGLSASTAFIGNSELIAGVIIDWILYKKGEYDTFHWITFEFLVDLVQSYLITGQSCNSCTILYMFAV